MDANVGKRSTLNAQRSTFNGLSSTLRPHLVEPSGNVEHRWGPILVDILVEIIVEIIVEEPMEPKRV